MRSSYRELLKFKLSPLKSREGVTAIEYALLAGITVLAIVVGVTAVGSGLATFFSNLAGQIPTR